MTKISIAFEMVLCIGAQNKYFRYDTFSLFGSKYDIHIGDGLTNSEV